MASRCVIRVCKKEPGMIFNRSRILLVLLLMIGSLGVPREIFGQQPVAQTPNLQEMQKKIELLEKELKELKEEMKAATAGAPAAAKAPAEELPTEAIPGPTVQATTETRQTEEHSEEAKQSNSLNCCGFAMLDSGYNFGSINPDWSDTERLTQLPSSHELYGPNGCTFWGVRQTRFGVKSSSDTPLAELKTSLNCLEPVWTQGKPRFGCATHGANSDNSSLGRRGVPLWTSTSSRIRW